jgi:hypothetical protein
VGRRSGKTLVVGAPIFRSRAPGRSAHDWRQSPFDRTFDAYFFLDLSSFYTLPGMRCKPGPSPSGFVRTYCLLDTETLDQFDRFTVTLLSCRVIDFGCA